MPTKTPPAPPEAQPTDTAAHSGGDAEDDGFVTPMPTLEQIPISSIDRSRNHRRKRPGDEARIEKLAEQINAEGQLQAVRVYRVAPTEGGRRVDPNNPGAPTYILGFGWRRTEAMIRLGYELVRAEVFPPAPDHQIEAARAMENIARQDITPIEEAQAVADILTAYEKDHPDASHTEAIEHAKSSTGQSVRWVRDRDYFTRLTEPVRELALAVGLPAGHLRELAKIGDADDQFDAAASAAGAWGHWFDSKGALEEDGREDWAEFLEELAQGRKPFQRLREVQASVANAQRSLRSVPWQMQLPVLVPGKSGLPACEDCRHNSATDHTLFGVEADDDGPAVCANPGCFAEKTNAAEAERAKLLKKFGKRKQAPDIKELRTAVEQACPWLDGKRAIGWLQRQLKKPPAERATERPKRSNSTYGERKPTAHEAALQNYRAAALAWEKDAIARIKKQTRESVRKRAALRLLCFARPIVTAREVQIPRVSLWESSPEKGEPKVPGLKSLGKGALELLALVRQDTDKSIVRIAEAKDVDWPRQPERWPLNPYLFSTAVTAFGAKPMPAFPAWADFAPAKDKPKPVAKKKATKKKPTRKKPTKKKVTKRGLSNKRQGGAA